MNTQSAAPVPEDGCASSPVVSVIVPAYNASATLAQTLRSVRAQTYNPIEIIVVDDGSSDDTADIAAAHAAEDSRIAVIRQSNQGVAAARNTGIKAATGALIAPIDADDLWASENLERQVATFLRSGPETTLVYCWYARIDEEGLVRSYNRDALASEEALKLFCRRNLVGHGSGAVMSRNAVLAAGGYDVSLRARAAQGAEDYKLYLELAMRGKVALTPDVLVGYRITPGNMSSDVTQMCRSAFLVLEEFGARYPHLKADLAQGRRNCAKWYLIQALQRRHFRQARALFESLAAADRRGAALLIAEAPYLFGRRMVRKLLRLFPRAPDAESGRRHQAPTNFSVGSLSG